MAPGDKNKLDGYSDAWRDSGCNGFAANTNGDTTTEGANFGSKIGGYIGGGSTTAAGILLGSGGGFFNQTPAASSPSSACYQFYSGNTVNIEFKNSGSASFASEIISGIPTPATGSPHAGVRINTAQTGVLNSITAAITFICKNTAQIQLQQRPT